MLCKSSLSSFSNTLLLNSLYLCIGQPQLLKQLSNQWWDNLLRDLFLDSKSYFLNFWKEHMVMYLQDIFHLFELYLHQWKLTLHVFHIRAFHWIVPWSQDVVLVWFDNETYLLRLLYNFARFRNLKYQPFHSNVNFLSLTLNRIIHFHSSMLTGSHTKVL